MSMFSDKQVPNRTSETLYFGIRTVCFLHATKGMTEVSTSLQAYECLRAQINPFAEEVWIIALNSHLKMIKTEMVFRGTADHCLIHPRDIFRTLILCNASSFVMAHNHPSDEAKPSEQDVLITRKINQLAKVFQITLNDHIVMTSSQYFSMADHGFFKRWKKNADVLNY